MNWNNLLAKLHSVIKTLSMTEKQKQIVNSERYWEEVEMKKQYIKQCAPVTPKVAKAQQRRRNKALGINDPFLDTPISKLYKKGR